MGIVSLKIIFTHDIEVHVKDNTRYLINTICYHHEQNKVKSSRRLSLLPG